MKNSGDENKATGELKADRKIEVLVLSIAANQFTVPLPSGKDVVMAVNAHESLVATLETIADQMERATMVQDRSVHIIKQVCALAAQEARDAISLATKGVSQ